MRLRWYAIGAAVWALGYVLLYVTVVRGQGNDVAWWYVGLVWLASLLASSVVFVANPRPPLVAALVLYAACMFLGVLTVGLLLLPSVLATIVAVAYASPVRQRQPEG